MFGYTQHTVWTFLEFVVVLLQPMVLFLMTLMVFPSSDASRQDLRENFLAGYLAVPDRRGGVDGPFGLPLPAGGGVGQPRTEIPGVGPRLAKGLLSTIPAQT